MRAIIAALILTVAVAVAATALATRAQVVAQELPVGEFRVVPPSGPIGTSVRVSGDFDREITRVRFTCLYRELGDEGFDVVHNLAVPSPSFTFEYTIPAELDLRQPRTDVLRRAPGGECSFLTEAGHQLLTASVPFTVTEGAATLPSTGLTSGSHGAAGAPTAVVILAVGGVMLVLLGWKGVSTG